MTDSPEPKPTPLEPDPADEAPLGLADTNEGSTTPVAQTPPDEQGSSTPPPAPDASGGSSTGGFDTVLGKLIVQRGLATAEEVELCRALLRESSEADVPRTLGDILIDNEFVTPRQLGRLKSEFEAKHSTEQIPGYKILKKVGSGAMATVFLARQLSLDRAVAIKVLPKRLSSNESFIARFYKEGRAAAQLNHPNIVSAYDVGRAGQHYYFVMEFVDGETVHDRITKQRRLEESEAIGIVSKVAEALQHAHERGFIHRDIKPKNIMLGREGSVKLADLGLARAMSDKDAAEAEAGRAYGTPYYISPEQIRGEVKIGPAADIYGLGATFYHMVTGRVPFEGKNPSAVMHKHLKSQLVPPDHLNPNLSAGCAQVIEMMLAKAPRDRYERVTDLLEDLDLIRRAMPPHFAQTALNLAAAAPTVTSGPALPVVVAEPDRDQATQHPAFMIVLAIMIVSLLVNAVLLLFLAAK